MSTSAVKKSVKAPRKNLHAAALGRLGGVKGGRARALALTAAERQEIAKRAALARWAVDKKSAR